MIKSRYLLITLVLAFCWGCGSGSQNDNTDELDSGSDTDGDSDSDTDADSDTDDDVDTDSDGDGDSDDDDNDDDNSNCDDVEFPPSNGPDGCQRILLTKTPDGVPFNTHANSEVAISRDGSLAAFGVLCTEENGEEVDGLPEDTNGKDDVYAVDLNTMEIEIISVSSSGELRNFSSYSPSVSADGRYVAFQSNGIFVRDRVQGTTELVSVSSDGTSANNSSSDPVISSDGRYVLFASYATNLVPGDTNGEQDLFLRDSVTETTERLSVNEEGEETTDFGGVVIGISDDGRYVLLESLAALSEQDDDPADDPGWDVYLRDRETGRNLMPTLASDGYSSKSSFGTALSPDGTRVMFNGDSEHYLEIDVGNLETSTFLSVRSGEHFIFEPILRNEGYYGGVALFGMSADYHYFASGCRPDYLEHMDTTLSGYPIANVCVLDRDSGEIALVTAAEDGTPGVIPDYSYDTQMVDYVSAAISGDGKRIIFSTIQYGIVDDYDIPCMNTPRHVYLRDCP